MRDEDRWGYWSWGLYFRTLLGSFWRMLCWFVIYPVILGVLIYVIRGWLA